MSSERHGTPVLRVRDVVPAALCVILLLGVAGCMGAMGGGPLDGTPLGVGVTDEVAAPEPPPSIVPEDPDGPTPEYLFGFVDKLAESKRSGIAPEAFTNRKPLFSCGEFVMGQGAEAPSAGWDCLAAHLDTGAELVEVTPTVEGDPIISYYRVGPDIDGLEYFNDPTFDTFGADTWTHLVCELNPDHLAASLANCPWDDAE